MAAAAALLTLPAGAPAAVTDGGAAALSTVQEEAAAHSRDAGEEIICQARAEGGYVVNHTDFGAGEIFGLSQGVGQGKCASFEASAYTMRMETKIQWFDNVTWHDVPGCASSIQSTTAQQGVAVIAAQPVVCNFEDSSPYLSRWHRVRTTVWNTVDSVARWDVSPMWWSGAQVCSVTVDVCV